MSPFAREGSSSQQSAMLPSPKSPMHDDSIDAMAQPSQHIKYRRREVIDGDVVRTYESPRRRRPVEFTKAAIQQRRDSVMASPEREEALQAALDLPSSVLIVQGLRRWLKSDEPLYDELEMEQKTLLQKEYLKEVGVPESTCETALRQEITFPPSPPATPKPRRSVAIKVDPNDSKRFCECCRVHCV